MCVAAVGGQWLLNEYYNGEDTDAAFLARLERMEEAQRRMEDLLVRLASKLS